MRKKFLLIIFLAISCIALSGLKYDDGDIIKKISLQLDKWLSEHPQEKIHIHFDKPYYAIGDTIWFKSYVTVGEEHRLSALSGILNVELINDKDSVKKGIKIPLISGLGWGDFALPDTLAEGNYRIRAYTNWMRNAGEEYFFDKTITIVNAVSNKVFTKTNYTYTQQGGQQKINASINYTDLDSAPYAGKEVSYQVISNTRVISKGKGITNEKGELSIDFINNMPALFKSGMLVTVIKVGDKEKITKVIPIKAVSDKVDVQFFPESGYLVNGINSSVAFKATGSDGLGKDIKGIVKDEQGTTVTTFNASHLGMGVFNLVPQAGKTYTAEITYSDGSVNKVDLPKAQDSGYVVKIDNTNPGVVKVQILTRNVVLDDQLRLVAQANGQLLYAGKSKSGSDNFAAIIPVSRFPSGIVQFTLFSGAGQPLNERLVFIQKNDLLKLDISTEKEKYSPREKVKINLLSKNGRDSLVEGNFSIAVIDEAKVKVNEEDENSIMSDILLTSDLKGYIEKPNYYFTNVNSTTRASLDALMLTQGYRRFEWKQLLADNLLPPVYQPEKMLEVSGTVTLKGKPLPGAKVTMFNTTGNVFTADTISDAQGKFRFSNLLFTDSARLILQAVAYVKGSKRSLDIALDNLANQLVAHNRNIAEEKINLNEGLMFYLQNSRNMMNEQAKFGIGNRTIMLKEVVITEKKDPVKSSANLNGPGNADQVLTAKDLLLGCSTIDICLQSKLFGVVFIAGVPYSTRNLASRVPMQLIVDGAYVESSFLQMLGVNDVESVEVLRTIGKTAIYGSQGYGGLLIITTKRGGGGRAFNTMSPGIATYSPRGYYLAKTFYSPQHDSPNKSRMADLRSTIYWEPNMMTDSAGKAFVEYFNADGKGTYRVVIEGIDNAGNIGRGVYRYKVE